MPAEKRTLFTLAELRAEQKEEGAKVVEGYALKFDNEAELWPGFFERIAPTALDEADLSNVALTVNHNLDLMVARTINGSLELTPDETGLKVRAELADTQAGRDLYTQISDGLITSMSFAAMVTGTEYDFTVRDETHCTITKLGRFFDASAVVFPAYQETEIAARMQEVAIKRSELDAVNPDLVAEPVAEEPVELVEEVVEAPVEVEEVTEREALAEDSVELSIDNPAPEAEASTIERSETMTLTHIEETLSQPVPGAFALRGRTYNTEQREEFAAWADRVQRSADTTAGASVIPTVVADSIETSVREGGTVAGLCTITSISGLVSFAIEASGSVAGPKVEGSGTDEGSVTLEEVLLNPRYIQKWIALTAELDALSAVDFGAYILDEIIDKVLVALDTAILFGDHDANGKGAYGVIESDRTEVLEASEASWKQGVQARGKMKASNIAGAVAVMNPETFYGSIMIDEDTTGAPIFRELPGANGEMRPYYGALPVVFNDALPAFADAQVGDTFAVIGNFKKYHLNFPNGFAPETLRDVYTLANETKVRIFARLLGAGNVKANKAFVAINKKAAV